MLRYATLHCAMPRYTALCHAIKPVLCHTVFPHAVYAMLFFAVQCYATTCRAMASFLLSALTGVIGAFDGPLSFSDSSEYCPPCHAMPCHGFFPALCSDWRRWDVCWSLEHLGFLELLPPRHAMPCHTALSGGIFASFLVPCSGLRHWGV